MSDEFNGTVTPAWVREQVEAIRATAARHDDEGAHIEEDRLFRAVLSAIRDGRCEDPIECAREVFRVQEIGFSRWYA